MKKTYEKEKISAYSKLSRLVFKEMQVCTGAVVDDFVNDLVTIMVKQQILSNVVATRTIIEYCPRPKFFDWLFRRQRKIEFKLTVKDLLLKEPLDNELRLFIYEKI